MGQGADIAKHFLGSFLLPMLLVIASPIGGNF